MAETYLLRLIPGHGIATIDRITSYTLCRDILLSISLT